MIVPTTVYILYSDFYYNIQNTYTFILLNLFLRLHFVENVKWIVTWLNWYAQLALTSKDKKKKSSKKKLG